jgi:pimeloyl-ACP methyl ester carboxylesterase
MELRHVSVHGHRLAYRTQGSGPVLVLLHGMAGSSSAWNEVGAALGARFTVVAPDLLGHGESAKPRGEYSISGHANVLRDLLAALGHRRASIVGHSFGGGVAMQFAYQYPSQCERLVLVSSGGLGREVGWLLRALSAPGVDHVFPFVCSPALRSAGERMIAWLDGVGLRPAPGAMESWRAYAGLADRETRIAFFRTLRGVIDVEGQAVSAQDRLYLAAHLPTLIVWGGRDGFIPSAHARETHRRIPGSTLEIFESAGHFPQCDEPGRFAATLEAFVEATRPASFSEDDWHDLLRAGCGARPAPAGIDPEPCPAGRMPAWAGA